MAALQLLGADGRALTLEGAGAVDFGTITSGNASDPRPLKVKNAGDAPLYFTRVRAVAHPTAQAGALTDTVAATEFAVTERGAYARELELGTLAPGEERAFWVRWAVPKEAPAGAVVWAVEALGSQT